MILYLDTSALVKLYVEEAGSEATRAAVDRASRVVTARISYAEARATFARLARERVVTSADLRRLRHLLDDDWGRYTLVEINEPIVRRAGDLAERHGLRGYDAVQLSAAMAAKPPKATLSIAVFDDRLRRAARRERLALAV